MILGCNDRIAQVFTTTVKLLKSLLHAMDKKHGRSFKHFSHSFAEKVGFEMLVIFLCLFLYTYIFFKLY